MTAKKIPLQTLGKITPPLAAALTGSFIFPRNLQQHLAQYFILFQSPKWVGQNMQLRPLALHGKEPQLCWTMQHDGIIFMVRMAAPLTLKAMEALKDTDTVLLSYRRARPEFNLPPTVLIKQYIRKSGAGFGPQTGAQNA